MGLYDRDYWRDRQKEQAYVLNPKYRRPAKKTHKTRSLYWVALVFVILLFAGSKLRVPKQPFTSVPSISQRAPERSHLIPGGLIVYADRQGHYRGSVEINNISAPFMIDTGATMVVVPAHIANQAGLQRGQPISVSTAGGRVVDHLTVIDRLKIGNAELFNVPAAINQFNDEILIGMSALKYFKMTQNQGSMVLVTSNQENSINIEPQDPGNVWTNTPGLPPNYSTVPDRPMFSSAPVEAKPKATTAWKKTTLCDADGKCRTTYN